MSPSSAFHCLVSPKYFLEHWQLILLTDFEILCISMPDIQTVPPRSGVAVSLSKGQVLKVINTHGQQVVDTFAFSATTPGEFMSMSHTRTSCLRLVPAIGQKFVSNQRKPMLKFLEDTSPGIHDTLIAACDPSRYRQLGAQGYHDSCSDNLRKAIQAIHIPFEISHTPEPLNLFMNVPVSSGWDLSIEEPKIQPGGFVRLQAEMDLLVVMSACPMDLNAVVGGTPKEAHYVVE